MPLTSMTTDPDTLTMTAIADFAAPVERLWAAYADPRQIEKFWGPVEWPATFFAHNVALGGWSHYVMTGPNGEKAGGAWEYLAVDQGRSFEVRDYFTDEEGNELPDMPSMRMTVNFEPTDAGSRVTITTHFASVEQLEQLLEMGMAEGSASAMSQIDDVLADLESFAAGRGAEVAVLSDTKIRISRVIRGTVQQVWDAHHDPDLIRRWMLGPDGWTMPVCEVAQNVGDTYRNEWEPEGGGEGRFGFTGKLLEPQPPHREVTTESMIGMEGEPAINDMTLTEVEGGTLLTLVVTYPSAEVRDLVLDSGMAEGLEASYARLEKEVLV